ncbi:MAG TPA: hypothetical protein VHM28_09770 [Anaerolineales bacterium]|nr:hypothetical protein [Anaerolineales bacterium]
MATTSKSSSNSLFDINKCRAKIYGVGDLAECLTPQQVHFCGYSLSFGNIYFCTHPQKKEFTERTLKEANFHPLKK